MIGSLLLAGGQIPSARAEAMLQLFNVSWSEITKKMPELAEAGYGSIWVPPPTKGSGGLSVGYDMWDPFDLGSRDQRSTVRTRYGTEAELLQMIETAHRFGIRIYLDNIMNHRAFDVPGYNESTPTGGEGQAELYPGMVPEDFHLRKTEDGFYRKWDNCRDWSSQWQVQNLGLADLIDIAHETPNANFGTSEGSTHPKYSFVRDLERPWQYDKDKNGNQAYFGVLIDQARAELGSGASDEDVRLKARSYILANKNAYKEDVGAYLIRAARWEVDRTKADGLRLDAVKHVPDYFFGQQSGADKDASDAGYLGQVQWQFNRTRGFSDPNHRDSVFDEKKGRDDAMVFGEHLGSPPGYGGYWDAGMRLVDNDLRSKLNGVLGNPSAGLQGLDKSDYGNSGFGASLGVMHATSHDNDYASQIYWQHAYYMLREGMGLIYSDGYYQAETLGESGGAFPRHANTQYLGQYSDPRIPNILKIHNDFARGLQDGKWSDGDYVAFERRDNRDKYGSWRNGGTPSEEVTMVAMFNDNTAQGQARSIGTSFPSGAYLWQYAEGPSGSYQLGFYKYAWELGSVVVPPGGYYVFGWRTPELSTLWPSSAVTFYQTNAISGQLEEVPRVTVTRKDGPDGDVNFNPNNLANRGYPTGTTPDKYSYQTTVPVVKGGPVTILARADGSAENIMLKLDGGVDLNGSGSQPANRDYPPGVYSDIWVGLEQPNFIDRQHPEKFAAKDTLHCKIGSPGAETYVKTVGGGLARNIGEETNTYGTEGGNVVSFVYHDPEGTVGGPAGTPGVGDLQLTDTGSNFVVWVKTNSGLLGGFKAYIYYTTDGSFPEGAGGIGRGTTKVAALNWKHDQTGDAGSWWGSATIPKPAAGSKFIYKIGVYRTEVVRDQNGNVTASTASKWPSGPNEVAYKKKMLTTFRVDNFNPATVQFFPHNDYARKPDYTKAYGQWGWDMQTGLSEGFHSIRTRAFLNRNPDTSAPLYQTFTQTFYYDAQTPTGQILYPASNGDTVGGSSYEIVLRTDSTVEEVWFHITDGDNGNDDAQTQALNGNGTGFEPFVDANGNQKYDVGEEFTDTNGNGIYDASIPNAWGQATNSTSVNLPGGQKEWRFRYNNVPASRFGTADIKVRLLEASSSRNVTLDAATAHVTEIVRNVNTSGPDERVMIAWPQRDGDKVDDNYTMKVYFTQALADGTTTDSLKQRFTFSIASTESGSNRGAVVQSRDNFTITYNVNGYHELAIPLPNLYNDVPDFLHTLTVTYTFPDNRKLEAVRLVKANPSTKPFVRITRPTELGSDGKPTEIILPDGPGADQLLYTVRAEASATVPDNGLVLSGQPGITLFEESYTDSNNNGRWDDQEPTSDTNNNGVYDPPEPFVDANGNGVYDVGETFTDQNGNTIYDANESYVDVNGNGKFDAGENFFDLNGNKVRDAAESFTDANGNGTREGTKITVNGNTKTWDFTWKITAPGNYLLTATANLNGQQTSTVRNARVILRQVVDSDITQDNDDDNDGLVDINETNKKDLPAGNAETWSNGDVHIWNASGRTLATSPDTDSDGLPDGLEVGWRTATKPPTDPAADTNGDGSPNFIGDQDPPLYAVVENYSYVPGVGSQSQGDDRTRQAAGTVTDPTNPDTDGDGILDGVEDTNKNGWTDGDGKALPLAATRAEYATARPAGGDWPNNSIDSWETWTETSPTKADSDGDGLSDGYGEDKNGNGFIDGDTNKNRQHNSGEQWTETDPLKSDTDGDGLPDGWEVKYGLDPLDDGSFSKRNDGQGEAKNGPAGDPDGDGSTNIQELNSGNNPTYDDRIPPVQGEGSITIGNFTDWNYNDLLVLDEYKEGGSQGDDVYRSWNDTDNSRDIVAFSFRDGGDKAAGGDDRVYFRIDFMDLAANAWEGEVNAYIVIDTGNPDAGERSIPNEVDIATDMKWEVVVAAYNNNYGNIFVDKNPSKNTTTQYQNPVADGGVEARSFTGRNEVAWSSRYDAVEIAIERQHLKDAGWLGDPNSLHFQVFTTKPLTAGSGSGDLAGRNDIRDTIYDDWIVSDYWKDADNIALNAKLSGYFGRTSANDRNKSAKVMLVAHGNQAIQPASVTQKLIHDGAATNAAGYFRLIKTHEDYKAPLTLHLTPTLASALQWASNPTAGAANDGPALNARIASLVANNRADLVGSTFADHVPKYFQQDFNNLNKSLSDQFLNTIYGANAASQSIFWPAERVLDDTSLATIYNMGYRYTFADQMRHFLKWFGRTPALGTEGYRINEVNGMKIFPIHDVASAYLDQTLDEGSSLAVRQLLSRRSRSGVQDQVVSLWRDIGDFSSNTKASTYDTNVRWLSSRPWIRVVTAQQIADGEISYKGQDGNTYTSWGTVDRGTGKTLVQTAKDWIDHATGENYNNWYDGSANEEGLAGQKFGASTVFGKVGVSGHANEAWLAANSAYRTNLRQVAAAVIGGAMFETAFHNTTNNDLSKFSTGDYIYPDTDSGQKLADFARNTQAQARFAKIYGRVQEWAANANASTLAATAEDVDIDGVSEHLLYNSRIFAVFEKKGGRMTAAWLRDPSTGNIWQVAGNFASYSNTDTEEEGASNFVGQTTTVNAYRTSGFKDWWAVTGVNGSNTAVNADYTVTSAASGTGWTFSQGGISKTITLADASTGKLTATYSLSGPNKLYVRFGLAPNLLDLMLHGQSDLESSEVKDGLVTKRLNLLNKSAEGSVRAFVETAANSSINTTATDVAAGFTTVPMRNQAQTQQVEVEITGNTTVTLGFDQGETNPDTDNDGLPDSWENEKFGNLGQTASGDPDADGLSNSKEYVLGSNPNDAASGRPVTVKDANGFHVTFPTATGRTYTVLYRDSLSSGTWGAVSSLGSGQANPVAGTGNELTVTDTAAGGATKRFYRVEASITTP